MKILLINCPSAKGRRAFDLPLGLLYAAGIFQRCGHQAKIFDPYIYDIELSDFEGNILYEIHNIIDDYQPTIVGFGGIASSYGSAKKLSNYIKTQSPDIFQIAGGALSSVYDLLLTNTNIELVFHGETEVSLPIFLSKFDNNDSFLDTPGVSYCLKGQIIRNQRADQIQNIDNIPIPPYNIIDIQKYLRPVESKIDFLKKLLSEQHFNDIYKKIASKTSYISVVTSRGCTHQCLFCYRHVRGIRQHSVDYVINHIKYLKRTFGIEGYFFCDELFNSKPQWVMDFCDQIEKDKLDIYYIIGGARIDKINERLLNRLKETGCIEINYGHESGSNLILKEYRKGVTAERNNEITLLTAKKVGIGCPIQLVIGAPGETIFTIYETITFLKNVEAYFYSLNYLIPLPETPIWEYVKKNNLIKDVEKYLDIVASKGGLEPIINLTNVPDLKLRKWSFIIKKEMTLWYYKTKGLRISYYYTKILFAIVGLILNIIPIEHIKRIIPNRIRLFISK